jgi:hypothetical protein
MWKELISHDELPPAEAASALPVETSTNAREDAAADKRAKPRWQLGPLALAALAACAHPYAAFR